MNTSSGPMYLVAVSSIKMHKNKPIRVVFAILAAYCNEIKSERL